MLQAKEVTRYFNFLTPLTTFSVTLLRGLEEELGF